MNNVIPTKGGVILKVDPLQKERAIFGDIEIMIGVKYKINHRDKHPVIGIVDVGNEMIPAGTVLVTHHNLLYGDTCVYSMGDGLFSIPTNENIFMRIDDNGNPHSMFGNIICETIEEYTPIEKPGEHIKLHHDRAVVVSSGFGYKKGQVVHTVPFATYEINYNFGKIERRVVKIRKEDIVAVQVRE